VEFIWLLACLREAASAEAGAWNLVIIHFYHLSRTKTAPKFPSTRILWPDLIT
jgi:hypothetical protein